jgi:hypothetical protein
MVVFVVWSRKPLVPSTGTVVLFVVAVRLGLSTGERGVGTRGNDDQIQVTDATGGEPSGRGETGWRERESPRGRVTNAGDGCVDGSGRLACGKREQSLPEVGES